ncbi:hypothetical protein Q1695_008706 [Nippostrongylus brasiliensis]|nr:hypothetical protein Q1695_008706 [Nippostrongylus brasiliensis]
MVASPLSELKPEPSKLLVKFSQTNVCREATRTTGLTAKQKCKELWWSSNSAGVGDLSGSTTQWTMYGQATEQKVRATVHGTQGGRRRRRRRPLGLFMLSALQHAD